jgi:hypothetical protein
MPTLFLLVLPNEQENQSDAIALFSLCHLNEPCDETRSLGDSSHSQTSHRGKRMATWVTRIQDAGTRKDLMPIEFYANI